MITQAKTDTPLPPSQTEIHAIEQPPLSPTTLGARLKELREYHGYKATNLADKLGVSKQTISSWESGKTLISAKHIATLRGIYQISAEQLFNFAMPVDTLDEAVSTESELQQEKRKLEEERQHLQKERDKNFFQMAWLATLLVTLIASIYPLMGLVTCIGYLAYRKRLGIRFWPVTVCVVLCLLYNLYGTYVILDDLFFHIGYGEAIPIESFLNWMRLYHI